MRATWAIAFLFSSGFILSPGFAQPRGEDPTAAAEEAEKTTEKPLEQTEERTDLTPAQLRDLTATLRINKALDEETKIDVIETPLADVLQDIAKNHRISIVLDPEGCDVAGVTGNQLMTWNLKDISLRNALRAMLKPMRLGFLVRNEVLTITALDCPERLATVRTFPLGNLVDRMDDPSELISTLEIIWPDDEERVGEEKIVEPRARILANHLVVRGSPRHLELAEQLIDGLMAERPEPEVKATIKLPPGFKPAPLPLPSRDPAPLRRPKPVEPPQQEPEAARR